MAHERSPSDDRERVCDPPDEAAWELATFEGSRLQQLRAFQALSFREKILRIEQMNEIARALNRRRAAQTGEDPADATDRG